jgi:hypothetical protein
MRAKCAMRRTSLKSTDIEHSTEPEKMRRGPLYIADILRANAFRERAGTRRSTCFARHDSRCA